MAAPSPLQLYRVRNDPHSIANVARTITESFSQDPLIRWLRPTAAPWARDQSDTQRWQERRIRRVILEGLVFKSACVENLAQVFPPKASSSKQAVVNDALTSDKADAGAAVLLFPPSRRLKWTPKRILMALKLWLLDILSPAPDQGTDEKRVEIMLNGHSSTMEKIKSQYHLDDLWYLEVIAVHPALQSRGLGGKVISWILDFIQHQPIVLECTAEPNIKFYEKFGFHVVEEVKLADERGAVNCWMMLREATQKQESM